MSRRPDSDARGFRLVEILAVIGVIAILGVVLLKAAAIASLPESEVAGVAFLMPLAGRCALVVGINLLSNARAEGGLGRMFCGKRSWGQISWALAVLFVAAWIAAEWAGLIAATLTLVVIIAFSGHCYRKIGGATGDTLGATCELAETAIVVVMVATPVQWLA